MTSKGCPERVDKDNFCPCWYEGDENGIQLRETNRATGESRAVKGCYFQVTPRLLQFTVQCQEETTAEVSSMRERTAKHLTAQVRAGLKDAFLEMQPRVESKEAPKLTVEPPGST
jgi:hypothetical protein